MKDKPTEHVFSSWAIVELFGHSKIAGLATEQVIAGQGFLRVDVPASAEHPAFSRFFGPGAIYSITPTTEEIAILFARQITEPVVPYQMPRLALQKSFRDIEEYEEDDDEDGAE